MYTEKVLTGMWMKFIKLRKVEKGEETGKTKKYQYEEKEK